MTYRAPVEEVAFALNHMAGLASLRECPSFAEVDDDLVSSVLGEAGKLAENVLAPLNASADREGCRLHEGAVTTPKGFREAYQAVSKGGWGGLSAPQAHGGQGLPFALNLAVQDMFNAACMSFTLAPMLTQGAMEAIQAHGTPEQKKTYLPKLASGDWAATMNLTEPQAGSDVGALAAKAAPLPDGSYAIDGTKIFITFGEHDLSENIIHLVLARLPDAPAGSRGVSLFIVPKILENGERNGVFCIGLEEKLGIHASPTCVMRYGEDKPAKGFLLGEANGGMACMFTMMNNARLQVGIEGPAIAERAFQSALAYARERRQGRWENEKNAPIIRYPDVRRMLMTMKALSLAARGICYAAAVSADLARAHPDAIVRKGAAARLSLLTPIAKAWGSDIGVEAASLGIQVHGGMGFIEETGAALLLRDARIAPIYEGTNGIQANDLVGRKLQADGGAAMKALLGEIAEEAALAAASNAPAFIAIGRRLGEAHGHLTEATCQMLGERSEEDRLAGAVSYLNLAGLAAGGFCLSRAARAAAGKTDARAAGSRAALFVNAAHFYADSLLPQSSGLAQASQASAAALADL